MESFKMSLSRDFRIDVQAVDTVLNEEGEGDGGGGESDEDSEGVGDHPPSAKRLREN